MSPVTKWQTKPSTTFQINKVTNVSKLCTTNWRMWRNFASWHSLATLKHFRCWVSICIRCSVSFISSITKSRGRHGRLCFCFKSLWSLICAFSLLELRMGWLWVLQCSCSLFVHLRPCLCQALYCRLSARISRLKSHNQRKLQRQKEKSWLTRNVPY